MVNVTLDAIEIESAQPVTASIIWLHGLGADGHDFEPVARELKLSDGVRFVFPHAPIRQVTINGNAPMRAWFDILGLQRSDPIDERGIKFSVQLIHELIRKENARGIPTGRIILAGFSQGGAIALQCGLRYPESLAGILALSSFLPMAETLDQERSEANRQTPIFLAHGLYDPVLPLFFGTESRDALSRMQYLVNWKEYPMPHSVCAEEIRDINVFLNKRLKATTGVMTAR